MRGGGAAWHASASGSIPKRRCQAGLVGRTAEEHCHGHSKLGLPSHTYHKPTVHTTHIVLERSATVCTQVLKANESFSQGFDKPMGLGVKKKVRSQILGTNPF